MCTGTALSAFHAIPALWVTITRGTESEPVICRL